MMRSEFTGDCLNLVTLGLGLTRNTVPPGHSEPGDRAAGLRVRLRSCQRSSELRGGVTRRRKHLSCDGRR
eukprot:325582-Hanusia_phi.AAC.1